MEEQLMGARGPESRTEHFQGWSENLATLRAHYAALQHIAAEAGNVLSDGTGAPSPILGISGAAFERESFRIMVLGEFSSGKSTLINALLGKELLPTQANPATAFTTVLRWGEKEQAWLYRTADSQEKKEPVGIEEFRHEVSLQFDTHGAPRAPAYALAVVEQPLEILRRSVEIVDSAGINESPERERVTLRFLEEVDAVIFVTDAGRPFTAYETEHYLQYVRQLGHRDIFFVVNQFDRIDEKDRDAVISRCRNIVAGLTGGTEAPTTPNVFFVSALEALKARIEGNAERARASAIGQLEGALELFCMQDAARVKFVRLAEFLRQNAVGLRQRLHDEGALLMKSSAELNTLLSESQETQNDLRQSAEAIREIVSSRIAAVGNELQLAFSAFLTRESEEVLHWDTQKQSTARQFFRPFGQGGRLAMQHELQNAYTSVLQRKLQLFSAKELEPLVRDRQKQLLRELEPMLRTHAQLLDKLRTEVTGSGSVRNHDHLLHLLAVSASQGNGATQNARTDMPWRFRPNSLLAAGAGAGAAVAGGTTAATAAGIISLGIVLPPLGLTLAIGAALGPLLAAASAVFASGKLRDRIAMEFAEHIKESAGRSARQYADSRTADLRGVWGEIGDTLHSQLQELIGSVQRNIEQNRTDEQSKRNVRDALYLHEQQITEIEQRIASFLRPLVTQEAPD
ncbi:dynamin family protein [Streptomyces sp. NPDC127108]|uniref:dynamin family protein n=1 Tax=Streptomyces sp. NPDC127108 TaxID=3345361 RepID=UPI0036403F78